MPHSYANIQMGTTVVSKIRTYVCHVGERGVVYLVSDLNGPLYSVIFEHGEYDGFSIDEAEKMLTITGTAPDVADYTFTNVFQLNRDFIDGRFAAAFPPLTRREADHVEQRRTLD